MKIIVIQPYALLAINFFAIMANGFLLSFGRLRHQVPCCFAVNPQQGQAWNGQVVAGDGRIRGCSLQSVSLTSWNVTIDGVEADLGAFSKAIYQKILRDAKSQRYQGFKPGTIPPHLEKTFVAFAMDECARETVLEALQQNNVRPFETCRNDLIFSNFQIPPTTRKEKKNKSKRRKVETTEALISEETEQKGEWKLFDSMKEAIDAGWRPGQSFSFVATNVKGQKVKDETELTGAIPVGDNY
jgi:hypothetical protein